MDNGIYTLMWFCTEILQAGSSAAIAALAIQHRDNQNAFIAEGVIKFVSLRKPIIRPN